MLPRNYVDAVVTLSINVGKDKNHIIGTGFLVGRLETDDNEKKSYSLYLITNKHVIKGRDKMLVGFNQLGGVGFHEFELLLFDKGKKMYSPHPNKDVDIIAVSINCNFLNEMGAKFSFFRIDEDAFNLKQMELNDVYEGDLTYQLGYPLNLVGASSKNPICRFGCISRISNLYIPGHPELNFLVDSQSFPGNSGGPVILRPEPSTISGGKSHLKSVLIGILYSYVPYRDPLISQQTGEVYSIMQENSGLTNVHPVDQIIDAVEIEKTRIGTPNTVSISKKK